MDEDGLHDEIEEMFRDIPENPLDCLADEAWKFILSIRLSNMNGGKKKTSY